MEKLSDSDKPISVAKGARDLGFSSVGSDAHHRAGAIFQTHQPFLLSLRGCTISSSDLRWLWASILATWGQNWRHREASRPLKIGRMLLEKIGHSSLSRVLQFRGGWWLPCNRSPSVGTIRDGLCM